MGVTSAITRQDIILPWGNIRIGITNSRYSNVEINSTEADVEVLDFNNVSKAMSPNLQCSISIYKKFLWTNELMTFFTKAFVANGYLSS